MSYLAKFSYVVALVVLSQNIYAQEVGSKCKVTDPTGTPLNVRKEPAGKILRTIANNRLVVIRDYDDDEKGQPWVLISDAKTGKRIGWVIREFVSCSNRL